MPSSAHLKIVLLQSSRIVTVVLTQLLQDMLPVLLGIDNSISTTVARNW